MEFRPDAEVRKAFAEAAERLDHALQRALPDLLAEHVSIRESSNRSGFDWSGYGHPSWRHTFERRSETVAPLCSVSVRITYEEPIDASRTGQLTARVVTDVFHLGAKPSLFRVDAAPAPTLEELSGDGLLNFVTTVLREAEVPLPEEYRELLRRPAPATSWIQSRDPTHQVRDPAE